MLVYNVGEVLARRALRTPDREAVVDLAAGNRTTFAELDRRANRVANSMLERGVEAGDRVGLLLANGTEFVESFYGLAKAGAISVLLNWRLVADELEYLLDDSGTAVLIFGDDFRTVAEALHERGTTPVTTWIHAGPVATRTARAP